jgi:hypothetical protein
LRSIPVLTGLAVKALKTSTLKLLKIGLKEESENSSNPRKIKFLKQ